jgi:hypothetical protein
MEGVCHNHIGCEDDWTGQWYMVANKNYNFKLNLLQKGNQITGTMTSIDDLPTAPGGFISGTVSPNGTSIQFTRELAGQQKQVYTGSLYGATSYEQDATGTFDQNGQGQYPWKATRYIDL